MRVEAVHDESTLARLQAWLATRMDRGLLVLADLAEPLRPHARFFQCTSERDEVLGAAVLFFGMDEPIVSAAADDETVLQHLLLRAMPQQGAILALSDKQPAAAHFDEQVFGVDPWMVAPCTPTGETHGVEPLMDVRELEAFYARYGAGFWCPSMLEFGHAFGIRDPQGVLISAGSVGFVLPELGYAQVGPLATATEHRRKSLAGRVLAAIRESLAKAGIARCGLLADASDPSLETYYEKRGFQTAGAFRFMRIDGAIAALEDFAAPL